MKIDAWAHMEPPFCVEPLWVGTKVCSRHLGHVTKMAARHIYDKNYSTFFSGTSGLITTKLGMKHWGLWPIIDCSNDDTGLTLAYFTRRSNLVAFAIL